MQYSVSPEILGTPSLNLDGELNEPLFSDVCQSISDFTGIGLSKVVYFVKSLGLKSFFANPSLLGISEEQKTLLKDLEVLIQFGAENAYGTDVTNESI